DLDRAHRAARPRERKVDHPGLPLAPGTRLRRLDGARLEPVRREGARHRSRSLAGPDAGVPRPGRGSQAPLPTADRAAPGWRRAGPARLRAGLRAGLPARSGRGSRAGAHPPRLNRPFRKTVPPRWHPDPLRWHRMSSRDVTDPFGPREIPRSGGAMQTTTLDQIKLQLEDRRERLQEAVARTGPEEELVGLLAQVDAALGRLGTEDYGVCVVC